LSAPWFPPQVPLHVLAWLVTFLVHSTLLLGAVWLMSRRVQSHAWREFLWKTALVGGLATASVQVASGWHPFGGAGLSVAAETHVVVPATGHVWTLPVASPARAFDFGDLVRRAAPVLAGLWVLGAALGLARFLRLRRRLVQRLRDRRPVTGGPARDILSRLREEAGFHAPVALSTLEGLAGPISFGRSEICVPSRFLTELGPEHQETALAHELAHLVRRDPLWLWVGSLLENIFFLQPLIRFARRELRESAEYLCDDWAARRTGGGMTLAVCLATVASWRARPMPALSAGMADAGSPLVRRIERLLDDDRERAASPRRRAVLAAALLVLTAVAGPGIGVRQASLPSSQAFAFAPPSGISPEDMLASGGFEIPAVSLSDAPLPPLGALAARDAAGSSEPRSRVRMRVGVASPHVHAVPRPRVMRVAPGPDERVQLFSADRLNLVVLEEARPLIVATGDDARVVAAALQNRLALVVLRDRMREQQRTAEAFAARLQALQAYLDALETEATRASAQTPSAFPTDTRRFDTY